MCGLQALDIFDFDAEFRFIGSRFSDLECSKHLLADDSMEVALMTELLHRGADPTQADKMVSFCCNLWVAADGHKHFASLLVWKSPDSLPDCHS